MPMCLPFQRHLIRCNRLLLIYGAVNMVRSQLKFDKINIFSADQLAKGNGVKRINDRICPCKTIWLSHSYGAVSEWKACFMTSYDRNCEHWKCWILWNLICDHPYSEGRIFAQNEQKSNEYKHIGFATVFHVCSNSQLNLLLALCP